MRKFLIKTISEFLICGIELNSCCKVLWKGYVVYSSQISIHPPFHVRFTTRTTPTLKDTQNLLIYHRYINNHISFTQSLLLLNRKPIVYYSWNPFKSVSHSLRNSLRKCFFDRIDIDPVFNFVRLMRSHWTLEDSI